MLRALTASGDDDIRKTIWPEKGINVISGAEEE
jgi:hypothetical protein